MSGNPPEPNPISRDGARPGEGLDSTPPGSPAYSAAPDPIPEPPPVGGFPPYPYAGQTMQPQESFADGPIRGQPYGQYGSRLRKSPYATPSLILGILGVVSMCGVTGPVGLGLGLAALKQIDTQPQTYGGRRLAIAGIVTGAIGSLWMVFWVMIAVSA